MTSSALRVGVVVPCFAPFRGGMEAYVAHAAAALAARGAEVTSWRRLHGRRDCLATWYATDAQRRSWNSSSRRSPRRL
jgi:hypothetical protein